MKINDLRVVYHHDRHVILCRENGYTVFRKDIERPLFIVPHKYDCFDIISVNPCAGKNGGYVLQVFISKPTI